jgi:hypothetical protein
MTNSADFESTLVARIVTAIAAGAIILVPGCATSTGPPLSLPGAVTPSQTARVNATGQAIATRVASPLSDVLGFGHAIGAPHPPRGDLFVSDTDTGAIEILENRVFTPEGTITAGLSCPDGEWTDTTKNLYVANCTISGDGNVREYSPGSRKPKFTYRSGLIDPIFVTTDTSGDVFVGDFICSSSCSGAVDEYAQGRNALIASCPLSGGIGGVAVDSSTGNVFVSHASDITLFAGGLTGCKGSVLGATVESSGGMILDANKNLIICDQGGAAVDVIAPPYTKVTRTIGRGWVGPFQLALTRSSKRLYVVDARAANVQVFTYPAGTLVTTLGSNQGILGPLGVTDTDNAVI